MSSDYPVFVPAITGASYECCLCLLDVVGVFSAQRTREKIYRIKHLPEDWRVFNSDGKVVIRGLPVGSCAVRKESTGNDLGRLSSGYIVSRSKVRLATNAWFTHSSTGVALHHIPAGKALDEFVENVGRRSILEGLTHRGLRKACGIAHDLRGLPAGSVSEWSKVRHVVDAWLAWPSAYVPAHVPSVS